MRKFIVSIVLSLYIASSIGVCVSMHYCGDNLTSTSILAVSSPKCPCGSEKMKKDCCEDKEVAYTIDDYQNHESNSSINFKLLPTFIAFDFPKFDTYQELKDNSVVFIKYYPPPDNYSNPIYIINQVFLI